MPRSLFLRFLLILSFLLIATNSALFFGSHNPVYNYRPPKRSPFSYLAPREWREIGGFEGNDGEEMK
ncbi:unnamed protein product, partial [Mesorhabditis belari]|uniref:Uncharacterized protein n=1 Tax=Mesorhabditis belari TaxID=2138241 RepID=A0AAF3EUJ2_9BILA